MAIFEETTESVALKAPKTPESFVESYESFTRIINRLQRKYLDLKEESDRQERLLAEANSSLRKLTLRNRAVTEFLNSILSSVSSGIVVVNREGRISHINSAAEEIFGISATQAVGREYSEVVRCVNGPVATPLEMAPAEPGRRSPECEKEIQRADGSRAVFLAAASPLMDAEGNSFGAVEVFQDISRLKEMEREMARLESLAQLGEMAASVAHQVRNPLVSVKGFASLITAEEGSDPRSRERAERILSGVEDLERVISALLKFSNQEALTRKPTNLIRYLKKVVRQIGESADGSNCKVEFKSNRSRATADIDQIVLREALQNVIHNAFEAAEGGVRVSVTLDLSDDRSGYVISIRDDGPGIPRDILENIFRPFFSTKARGSGLGLALARKIALAHGGELGVQSDPGHGAEFILTLPVSQSTDEVLDK